MDFKSLFLGDTQWGFMVEIFVRSGIMFVMILLILRLSGKRGVRQLSLFEVAIILGLGSAAGDPMFQEDIPILHALIVFSAVMIIYKSATWLAAKSTVVHRLLEGEEMIVVKHGVFDVKHEKDNDFSTMEFFTELRNLSVEHLGQVRIAVLEPDGSMSVLFYADEDVQFGLPLFPEDYRETDPSVYDGAMACMYCGCVRASESLHKSTRCPRCKHNKWAIALNNSRIA